MSLFQHTACNEGMTIGYDKYGNSVLTMLIYIYRSANDSGVHSKTASCVKARHSQGQEKKMTTMDPEQLWDTLFVLLAKKFSIRSAAAHYNLKTSHFALLKDPTTKQPYLEYSPETKQQHRNAPRRVYQNDSNSDCCIVRVYQTYIQHRHPEASDALYLRPLAAPPGQIWFSKSAVGRQTIQNKVSALLDGVETDHNGNANDASNAPTREQRPTSEIEIRCRRGNRRSHHVIKIQYDDEEDTCHVEKCARRGDGGSFVSGTTSESQSRGSVCIIVNT